MTQPAELEYLSTDELIEELKRRTDGGLFVTMRDKTTGNDGQGAIFEHWGGGYLALGLAERARHNLQGAIDSADEPCDSEEG